jgi:hypothetical protein
VDWSDWTGSPEEDAATALDYARAADQEIAQHGESEYSDYLASEAVAYAQVAVAEHALTQPMEGEAPTADPNVWDPGAHDGSLDEGTAAEFPTGSEDAAHAVSEQIAHDQMMYNSMSDASQSLYEANVTVANNIGGWHTEWHETD